MKRILAAAAAVPAVAAALAIPPASAAAHTPAGLAVSHLANRPDSGSNGNWAYDGISRMLFLYGGRPVTPSDCGAAAVKCFAFTGLVDDSGTFRTIRGAYTPNQDVPGLKIRGQVSGSLRGSARFAFDASAMPDAALVPRRVNGAQDDTASWYTLAFPHGTTFDAGTTADADINPWSWSYQARCVTTRRVRRGHRWHPVRTVRTERWTDAGTNGDGDLRRDGNITGCAA